MDVGPTVTTAGFWFGTLLPFVYVPVFVTGIDSVGRLTLVLTLLAINVVALVIGHDYPETRTR